MRGCLEVSEVLFAAVFGPTAKQERHLVKCNRCRGRVGARRILVRLDGVRPGLGMAATGAKKEKRA